MTWQTQTRKRPTNVFYFTESDPERQNFHQRHASNFFVCKMDVDLLTCNLSEDIKIGASEVMAINRKS